MPVFTNISAYQFAPLDDLKDLRARLIASCRAGGLKGTILLSTEGINLFVAGPRTEIDRLVEELRALRGLAGLTPKFSESDHQPFHRMLVKIKKEIIAFGVEGIDPARRTSPKLAPKTLKQWLDEGRPITLLDTRNDYEVKLGTFTGALPAGIGHFRDFPDAVRRLPPELKEQPIVMFCTGGIRCEKAGPFMEREGFKTIYQLDGGILKYFEECGSAHYDGECFVFDQRVGVDPALRETGSAQCFNCQTPLTAADQAHPHYVSGQSCPHCYRSPQETQAERLLRRNEALRRVATPLPGSRPYANRRPLVVSARHEGLALLDFLGALFPRLPRDHWETACAEGRLQDAAGHPLPPSHPVKTGDRYLHLEPETVEPPVNAGIRLIYEDDAVLVIDKPAPLPMHPSGRFNRNTLEHLLGLAWHPYKPRPAHRLDANTTGVVVFALTQRLAGRLQPQFARGEVEKRYLVRVGGRPVNDRFSCDAPISAEPGLDSLRAIDASDGRPARTEFQVLARHADGTTLLEARPLSGRTNQIRLHLWSLGLPVCGDPTYCHDRAPGASQTLPVDAPPLCLHAWQVTFNHPATGERVTFEAERPAWAQS